MRVHGELLAAPVHRAAKAAQLAGDGAATFGFPFPNFVDEIFAAVVGALVAFGFHLALDNHLRCDASVVGTDYPQRILAAQAFVTDHNVLQCVIQRVTDVQRAGYVRRWINDRERGRVRALWPKEAIGFPVAIPFRFDRSGIKGLVERAGGGLRRACISHSVALCQCGEAAARPAGVNVAGEPLAATCFIAVEGLMREWADFTFAEAQDSGVSTLVLTGPLRVHSLGKLDSELAAVTQDFAQIDMSGVTDIDTTGAWLVSRYAKKHQAKIVRESDQARRLFAAVGDFDETEPAMAERLPRLPLLPRTVSEIGEAVVRGGNGFLRILGFLGELIVALGQTLRRPSRLRGTALIHHMHYVGVNSLGIIGLMSFLIGIVIAQQGAVQLQQFGAEFYTINLTGRLSFRELGILMTSIMVAGRSGSAFAAQIGTMKLTEEIDAMRTIGVSAMDALVVPRVLASVLMMPLLGFYASVMAVIGGAFIASLTLDIPFFTFLKRIQEVVPITDVWIGILKAPVFALIVAVAGCYQGMQVKANAEEVGLRTTQAVVLAIFTVIVLDAFFAIFFTEMGWK